MRSTAIDRTNDSLAEKAAFAIGKVIGLTIVFLIAVMAAILILAGLVQVILWVKP